MNQTEPGTKSQIFGHEIEWRDGEWVYSDTKAPIPERRKCPHCKKYPLENGEDPCLGHIEGAKQACCGHGSGFGYAIYRTIEKDGETRTTRITFPVDTQKAL